VIDEVLRLFPETKKGGGKVKVLVPGSGLGRLPYELAKRGFQAEGNEFTYFMLLMSNYILNQSKREEQWGIRPYIHSFSNLKAEEDAFQEIRFPDECPS
jgi:carnosine N-methyltransferase